MIRKTITVTPEQDQWIQAQVAKGDYGSDSEIIRDALRLKQAQADELAFIRQALELAEAHEARPVEREALWQDLTQKLKQEGKIPS